MKGTVGARLAGKWPRVAGRDPDSIIVRDTWRAAWRTLEGAGVLGLRILGPAGGEWVLDGSVGRMASAAGVPEYVIRLVLEHLRVEVRSLSLDAGLHAAARALYEHAAAGAPFDPTPWDELTGSAQKAWELRARVALKAAGMMEADG